MRRRPAPQPAPDRPVPAAILATGLTVALLAAGGALADGPGAGGDTEPALPDTRWTVEDIVAAEYARDWTLSRDGRLAAWVESTVERVDDADQRVGNLQLCRLDGEADRDGDEPCRPLTRGRERLSSPAFSPSGELLAYRSSEKPPGAKGDVEPNQVWVLRLDGGAPWPITSFDRPVADFGWIDDGTLAVLAAESPSAWEEEREEAGDTSVVVEDAEREPPVRLYRVEIGGATRRLTANRLPFEALAVSPDGRRAVVREIQSLSFEFDARTPPHLLLVDLETGERQRLLAGSGLLPLRVRWAPDSRGIYFVDPRSNHPIYRDASVLELYFLPLDPDRPLTAAADGEPHKLPLHEWGLGGGYAPTADGVVALEAAGVRYRPVRLRRRGDGEWERRPLAGEPVARIDGLELAGGDDDAPATLLYQRSSATLPPQWYVARLDGDRIVSPRRLTRLNPSWKHKPTGRVETLRWRGALDDEVEGLLHYPLDWPLDWNDGDERRPLLLHIHGGPSGVDRDSWGLSWAEPLLLWRQRGAFVLQVNYHGSSNYGLDWVTSIEKRYYELEVPDLEAGVDHVIGLGLADPERLATAGWSNGGILSAALIAHTRRYRAASIGAADIEWISDWGNVDFGASFDNYYFGGPPWEIPEVYLDKSPFFDLPEVTTPAIVFTGTEDRAVPPHQSWSLFRVMQQVGEAPVRLVLFPDEPHSLRKPAHQRRKVEEELAWLDRYVLGDGGADGDELPEAVAESSPLAALLGRAGASRVDGLLGVRSGGVLAPELVDFRGLRVGRFEVTRAQWKAFEPSYAVGIGEADLPATGISFERAEAYATWLRERTGTAYRLPTIAEAEALAAAGGEAGNTLARWVGSAPNPDDLPAVREAISAAGEKLGREAPLLLPVGSLPGTGEPSVFDLDGNAAEWAVDEEGSGEPVGPSADRADDPRGEPAGGAEEPAPEYVGLRLVVGEPTR